MKHEGYVSPSTKLRRLLGRLIFTVRWILYPINLGLVAALLLYVWKFLVEDYHLLTNGNSHDMEQLMVMLLGLVDASMVANLIIMIVQGSHQIFIHKFELPPKAETPQYLDHIDTGILKVKVALSISSITLVQILKDFVNLEHIDWEIAKHRMLIHGMALLSALVMAIIWKVTSHSKNVSNQHKEDDSGH